jgi:hypothetical protein
MGWGENSRRRCSIPKIATNSAANTSKLSRKFPSINAATAAITKALLSHKAGE